MSSQGLDSRSPAIVGSTAFAERGDERMKTRHIDANSPTRRTGRAAAVRPCFALAAPEALEVRAR